MFASILFLLLKKHASFLGAVVGFQIMTYQVEETIGKLNVCVVVHKPSTENPIEFDFVVGLSANGTAGNIFCMVHIGVIKMYLLEPC